MRSARKSLNAIAIWRTNANHRAITENYGFADTVMLDLIAKLNIEDQ